MCSTTNELIENLYYMNTGTPKPSARFYHAQINGGWTCEKRFMAYAPQIGLNTLPGFMMFTRTAQAFQNGDEMQYVCLFFHDDSNALVNIAQELLQVPFFREVCKLLRRCDELASVDRLSIRAEWIHNNLQTRLFFRTL